MDNKELDTKQDVLAAPVEEIKSIDEVRAELKTEILTELGSEIKAQLKDNVKEIINEINSSRVRVTTQTKPAEVPVKEAAPQPTLAQAYASAAKEYFRSYKR